MQLSELIFYKNKNFSNTPRKIPDYVLPVPPLRSLPGMICNTSYIFEYILDIAKKFTLKKGEIIYPDNEGQVPFCYFKKGKICTYQIDEEGNFFISHFLLYGTLFLDVFSDLRTVQGCANESSGRFGVLLFSCGFEF